MFNKKKNKLSFKAKEPRQLAEIENEYARAANQAGQVQYQLFVYGKELEVLNEKMLELNREGKARKDLDAKANPEKEENKDV